jgi:hypothetical protein
MYKMASAARKAAAAEPAGMETPPGAETEGMPQGVTDAHAKGLVRKKFTLFNTITKLPKNLRAAVKLSNFNVQPEDLVYDLYPPDLPTQFDPRDPKMVPEEQRNFWFYKASDGDMVSAISIPLDQAGCGSCWAYATADMFSDRIRIALLKRFDGDACLRSRFFDLLDICTGETGILEEQQGVVNPTAATPGLYAVEVRDRVSPYWVTSFSPKMRETCPRVGFEDCTYSECDAGIARWRHASAPGGSITDFRTVLKGRFGTCLGCEGNHIAMPMLMFTGALGGGKPAGSAAVSDFTKQDWVCLFGTPAQQKTFCRPEIISPGMGLPFPHLYKADRYSYATDDDFITGYHPPQVRSMEQWFMTAIYNDGPIAIGYNVYQSFMEFFQHNPKGIYKFTDFLQDIQGGKKNGAPLGGHAVVIVGWGEVQDGATLTQYWVVRNSWGFDWGDGGFFRIERNIDLKLRVGGFPQRIGFEQEFAAVYFAPRPNPGIYRGGIQTNSMLEFLKEKPGTVCRDTHLSFEEVKKKYGGRCSCPSGYIRSAGGVCVKDVDGLGPSRADKAVQKAAKNPMMRAIVIILFIIIVISAAGFVWRKKMSSGKAQMPSQPMVT